MSNLPQTAQQKQYVEEVGIVFEQTGLPRMAGRILGRLLIAHPPHQSMDELTEALMASKGSISSMTRLLIQVGLIERVSLPGVRHAYFRLRPDAWQHMVRRGLVDEIRMVRDLAERGLSMQKERTATRTWLEEMRDVYTFLEREFPVLLERWEKRQQKSG
jgi:DNA-binding transcriptional regulator GbsR (MarR family)